MLYEHRGACTFLNYSFVWIYSQEWDYWIIWSSGHAVQEWQLQGTGETVRRYPTSKGKGEAPARWYEGRICIQNQTPFLPETLRGLTQTLCAPGPRDPTETETELCLSISCGGQQWPATETGALGAADLGMA